jgi:hypothetical protein
MSLVTNFNLGNFAVDGVYSQGSVSNPTPVGPSTSLIAIDGGANYGEVDTPTPCSDEGSIGWAFGTDTTSENALVRAALSTQPEANNLLLSRVTDGTDSSAVIDVGASGPYATGNVTVTAGIATGMTCTLTLTNGSTVVHPAVQTVAVGDTIGTFAQKLIAAINASAAVVGPLAFLQQATLGVVATTAIVNVTALNWGTVGNSIHLAVVSEIGGVTGNQVTCSNTLSGGSASLGDNFLVLTNKLTGSLPTTVGAACIVTVQSGSIDSYPVLLVAISFPGYGTEFFPNIVAFGSGSPGFAMATAQANAMAAINGALSTIAGSQWWTASAGDATNPPIIGTPQVSTGGTDGTAGITPQILLGNDVEIGATGIYAFRGKVLAGQTIMAGNTDPSIVQSFIAFGQEECSFVWYAGAMGTTTDELAATRQSFGLAQPNLLLGIDYDYVYDANSGLNVYVDPCPKLAAVLASQPTYQSPGNQPPNGVVGVNGTEQIVNGISYVNSTQKQKRQQNGILYLGYMPRALNGPQLGLPHGMTSDGVTRISDVRMLFFIIGLLQQVEEQYVDGPVDTNLANLGQPTFGNIQGAITAVLTQMRDGKPKQISGFSLSLDGRNTPTTIGQGYLFLSCVVTTLSSAQFIVNFVTVGANLVVQVSTPGGS